MTTSSLKKLPSSGGHVAFGRIAPNPQGTPKAVRLRDFLQAPISPPAACDYGPKADLPLRDIYGNDMLGDCIFAAMYHFLGVVTGNAGTAFIATRDQVIHDYSAVTGYNPADPSTDQGGQIADALNYFTQVGFADGSKLAGWVAIDGSNWEEVKLAIYLFESVIKGLGLPEAWVSPMPSGDGFVWQPGTPINEDNGHCWMSFGYKSDAGTDDDSWALEGLVTRDAHAVYWDHSAGGTGEMYAPLSAEILGRATGRAPSGVDWTGLKAALAGMGGSVVNPDNPSTVVPAPDPAPPSPAITPTPEPDPFPAPEPTEVVMVTCEEAVRWALCGAIVTQIMVLPNAPDVEKASPQEVAEWIVKNWPTAPAAGNGEGEST